jgi:cytidylate kinase
MNTKIVLSGLTAAGKTTHTKLLAQRLGYESVHVTDILLRELGIRRPSQNVWVGRLAELESMRNGNTVDDQVDEILLSSVREKQHVIVDAWAFPWYGPQDMLRIWIGSDRLSRAWKCSVSALGVREMTTEESATLIDEKDDITRRRFRDRYGFDLYSDRSVFDFVLDNSHLISEPTLASSEAGIQRFDMVLAACVEVALSGDPRPLMDLAEEDPDCAACVVQCGPRVRELLGTLSKIYDSYARTPTRLL